VREVDACLEMGDEAERVVGVPEDELHSGG
jgi:hypothetical protein